MVRLVIGTPGPMSAWGFALVEALMKGRRGFGKKLVDRHDVVAGLDEPGPERSLLVLSQYPNPSLADAIRSPRVPAVVFVDDPLDGVHFGRSVHRVTFLEALRAVSASTALIATLQDRVDLPVSSRTAGTSARDTAARIADLLDLRVSPTELDAALATLGSSGSLDSAVSTHFTKTCAKPAPPPSEGEVAIVRDVVSGVQARLLGRGYGTVTWAHGTFLSGDRPNESAKLVTDLTGPARVIYYGPYFHLPAGRWNARVVLGFCKDAVGTPFSIEAHSLRLLGQGRVRPTKPGVFSASVALTVDGPQDPIEIRLASASGAIEGWLSLGKVELSFDGS